MRRKHITNKKVRVLSQGLTAVTGIRVGHFTFKSNPRGCTVVLCDRPETRGSVEIRGGAPATRESDALDPNHSVQTVNAVVLTGGSAYGLASATGVMRWLQERGRGVRVGKKRMDVVPIVPAAAIFDLGLGRFNVTPTAKSGYLAASAATRKPVKQGNIGAGAGATAGKVAGLARAMRGGIGSVALSMDCTCKTQKKHRLVVGALIVVNPLGDVVNREGRILAGVRSAPHSCAITGAFRVLECDTAPTAGLHNSVIGVIATNARLNKVQCKFAAQMAQDGYARAIYPAHTPVDGDVLFSLATGTLPCDTNEFVVGTLAVEAVRLSIVRAVCAARSYTQRCPNLWIPSWSACRKEEERSHKPYSKT